MAVRPPLNALHVFCIVAREGGFRQAAQAMHLTPGAVSQQIQALEEHLKQVLFDRGAGSAASLTADGQRLYDSIASNMEVIVDIFGGAGRRQRQSALLVDTSVTLAMYWLIPQLPSFYQRHPGLRVEIRTVEGPLNPATPADIFIRRDPSELRDLPAHVFMREYALLVGSAALQAEWEAGNCDPLVLQQMTRIGARSRLDLWPTWAASHGVPASLLAPQIEFDNTILAIQAACQGLGVLVAPQPFVSGMLQQGSLHQLSANPVVSGEYAYAVGRKHNSAKGSLFAEWLHECGAMHATPQLYACTQGAGS